MESHKVYYASTHFYYTVKEDNSVEVSLQGNLYNDGGDRDYNKTSEFESQLNDYLKDFKYQEVDQSEVDRDEVYMEAMERAAVVKGSVLQSEERQPFYNYYILGIKQNKKQMLPIVNYVTLKEYLEMVEFLDDFTYLGHNFQ